MLDSNNIGILEWNGMETASKSARDGGGAPGRNSELIDGMGDGHLAEKGWLIFCHPNQYIRISPGLLPSDVICGEVCE